MRIDKPFQTTSHQNLTDQPWVAIFGNPNCGKTALFNKLTGMHQKVGNYPGITVERKSGWLKGHKIKLRDFPGTYSLIPKSLDEKIVSDMVQSWRDPKNRPMAVIVVLDATNLSRHLYLALQILDWGLPTIIALNMIDEVRRKGIKINTKILEDRLEPQAIIETSAKYGHGVDEIIQCLSKLDKQPVQKNVSPHLLEIERFEEPLQNILQILSKHKERIKHHELIDALRLVGEPQYISNFSDLLPKPDLEELQQEILSVRSYFKRKDIPSRGIEQTARFAYIDLYFKDIVDMEQMTPKSFSERVDSILTHRIVGPIVLLLTLSFIFNAIFSWAQYPMDFIENSFAQLSQYLSAQLPDGLIKSLIIDGVIAGVGSVLVFFPQILLLVFFLSILEDSGYMARMAFMLDRILGKIGLHGRSVLPLLSGFACAIPAVMSARTIDNWRDRLITIMIIPLMSCSARLPVYTLLIAAFIPNIYIFDIFSLQSVALMGIYFLGLFTAIFVALIFKKVKKPILSSSLIMELPPYRIPLFQSVWWQIYERGKSFLLTAGTIILAISIVLWFMASYPQSTSVNSLTKSQQIEQSYAGQLGHFIEPVIAPLGFDWKIGVGLVTSFAAREVIISTLSTLYNLEDEGLEVKLIDSIRNDRRPNGQPVFSLLTAISLMVFFAYAAQCMATFAVIKKETNSWRWPLFMVFYMTAIAYIASLVVYQGGLMLGFQ